jgi:hypothetical protein
MDEDAGEVFSSCRQNSEEEQFACQSSREVINSSGAREFTGENIIGRETLCFFNDVAPWVAEVGSMFLLLLAAIRGSCRQKVHRTVARARFALQHVKKTLAFRAVLEDEVGQMST